MLLSSVGTVLASGDETNPLIPAWGEVIIGTIAFGLLCWVLIVKAFPLFEKAFAERTDAIEGGIARADAAQAEAAEAREQYKTQLAELRGEAGRIREEAREQARQIREELQAEAQREMAQRQTVFEEQLAAERTQAIGQLRREVGDIAVELATRIVGHELESSARQQQIVDDFIAGLDAADASAGRV
jgi:F-type H+-transporting ATPase subunit b